MRKKLLWGFFLFFLMSLVYIPHITLSSKNLFLTNSTVSHPQDVPDKKPKYDYMSTFLSRAKPLGLKMNPELEKFLKQPSIKWAIRAGSKHILD
jgi:hypothetical protein